MLVSIGRERPDGEAMGRTLAIGMMCALDMHRDYRPTAVGIHLNVNRLNDIEMRMAMLHEIVHALGFSRLFWENFYPLKLQSLKEFQTHLDWPSALAKARMILHCPNLS